MKTQTEIVNNLRAPLEPAHGVWELYRRLLDAAATLIEQNERLIALMEPAVPEKK